MLTDTIGVRKTALMALSVALVGRALWVFGHSHWVLWTAALLFSPFGDAMLSAGLYKVALKKLTPPRLRPAQPHALSRLGAVRRPHLTPQVKPGSR